MADEIILSNRYLIQARKGAGGMAMVYQAHDLTLERTVAIKLLRKDFSDQAAFRKKFHQEAKAAAKLSHPNIVTIHDFGIHDNQLFIVMEYVSGIDLKTYLKQHGRLEIEESVDLILQACSGIGYAHRAGLVHCDVKPQNMLVTKEHQLKVLDFGIARALATIKPDEKTEVVWGSPQYFSPEQASGAAPSPASDVYSLGIILYELLTGQLPFTAKTSQELAKLHREALAASPRKLNSKVPIKLEQIIIKVLAKEPSARYRTADQLGKVIEQFHKEVKEPPIQGVGVSLRTTTPSKRTAPKPETRSQEVKVTPIKSKIKPSPVPIWHHTGINTTQKESEFDWLTWLLALLTLIAVGGLIPFWLWVFYIIKPPL
jgi:eukaryotic-like serine/threonine-protein kinase